MMALEEPQEAQGNEFIVQLSQLKEAEGKSFPRVRANAWSLLGDCLPVKKNESLRYLYLDSFFAKDFVLSQQELFITREELEKHVLPECEDSYLTFVQGKFVPGLSSYSALPSKAIVMSLEEAASPYGTLLGNSWNSSLQQEKDPFYLVNAALFQEGLFVYLPPKTVLEKPLQIINYTESGDQSFLTLPRVHFFFGAESEATIVERHVHNGSTAHCQMSSLEFFLEERASVRFLKEQNHLGEAFWKFDALRASLKKSSRFVASGFTAGSVVSRQDYRVTLSGEGSDAQLSSIALLEEKAQVHTNVLMEHAAPGCQSMQKFKTVLYDKSRSSFQGKILVRQIAQQTNAYQRNNNLVLSPLAHAYAKPNLEIFADDVKASHGATFGQVDKEQLFYLKTRGLTTAQAKKLLVFGFCEEVLEEITIPSLRARLVHYVN